MPNNIDAEAERPPIKYVRDSGLTRASNLIVYENGEWAVTDTGMEHLVHFSYHIPKGTLLDGRWEDFGPAYQQPIHAGCKDEVDTYLFLDAYYRALVHHGYDKQIDGLRMLATFARVLQLRMPKKRKKKL